MSKMMEALKYRIVLKKDTEEGSLEYTVVVEAHA